MRCATGELEQGVEGVGLAVLVAAGPAGRDEDVVDDRLERSVDPGAGIGCAAGLQVPSALGVGEAAQPPLPVDAPVRCLRIGITGGLGPAALLTQPGQRGTSRGVD